MIHFQCQCVSLFFVCLLLLSGSLKKVVLVLLILCGSNHSIRRGDPSLLDEFLLPIILIMITMVLERSFFLSSHSFQGPPLLPPLLQEVRLILRLEHHGKLVNASHRSALLWLWWWLLLSLVSLSVLRKVCRFGCFV